MPVIFLLIQDIYSFKYILHNFPYILQLSHYPQTKIIFFK